MAINRIGYNVINNHDQVKEAEAKKSNLEAPPIAEPQPTAPSSDKFARRPTMKSALLRAQLQTRLDTGKSVADDSIKAAALPEPVKRSVTFVYDAGPHNQ